MTASGFAADRQAINFSGNAIYPESASWSAAQKRFFIGSVRHGDIGTVDRKGNYRKFIRSSSMPSTFGVRVDDSRNHLWVTIDDLGTSDKSSPAAQGKLAAVAKFDSRTGKRLGYWDLASIGEGARNANDVVLDPAGNAYVTDSFAHVVYRIDTAGKLSVFADSPLFRTGEAFGLNGIAYHPDGYLLLGAWNSGEVFRVSLADPRDVSKVEIPERFKGMDGMALFDPAHLIASVNVGAPRAVELESDDGWKTARVVASKSTVSTFPSAVAIEGKNAWVLNSRLDTLIDPKASRVNGFVLQNFGLSSAK